MPSDLHIHTTASDGRLSPQEIILSAIKAKLSYIAITDHDTVSGLQQVSNINTGNLSVISGIEFSTDYPEYEIHILGYNINIYNTQLQQTLDILVSDRQKRAERILAKLKKLGFIVGYDQVLRIAGTASAIGRPHIARALVEKGYFKSVSQVFEQLIGYNGPAYEPHYKLKVPDAINLIKNAGGKAVLAHPGLTNNIEVIQWVIENGIDGIEVYHPTHTTDQEQFFLQIAKTNQLFITGGSDYHAIPGRYPEKLGEYTIPDSLARMLNAAQE